MVATTPAVSSVTPVNVFPSKVILEVTDDTITAAQGNQREAKYCPVARAARQAFNQAGEPISTSAYRQPEDSPHMTLLVELSSKPDHVMYQVVGARDFSIAFDNGEAVIATTFEAIRLG